MNENQIIDTKISQKTIDRNAIDRWSVVLVGILNFGI